MKVKIKDVAELAGTSAATVSRVINGDPNVSEELRQRVLVAIEKTGYIPNMIGRSLRTSKSRRILVMLPDISNQFYSKILRGIQDQARAHGYDVLTCVTHLNAESERRYLDMLKTQQTDGVISFCSTLPLSDLNALSAQYPIVHACEYEDGADVSYVMINNEKAAYDAVSHLAAKGHRRIGMLSGSYYRNSERSREAGYHRALLDAGLSFEAGLVLKGEYSSGAGEAGCQRLLELPEPVTALFTVSDLIAAGAVRKILDKGMVPGKDVDVIGFDNTSLAQIYNPTITTVAQPRYEIGTTAVDLLVAKMDNLISISKGMILPHKIMFRQSTGEAGDGLSQ